MWRWLYETPDAGSKLIRIVGAGSWVILIGTKQDWFCIESPCDAGGQCTGWVRAMSGKAPKRQEVVEAISAVRLTEPPKGAVPPPVVIDSFLESRRAAAPRRSTVRARGPHRAASKAEPKPLRRVTG